MLTHTFTVIDGSRKKKVHWVGTDLDNAYLNYITLACSGASHADVVAAETAYWNLGNNPVRSAGMQVAWDGPPTWQVPKRFR